MKSATSKVKKSYMLVQDEDNQWKVLTDRGLHILRNFDGAVADITFEDSVTALFGSVRDVVEGDNLEEAIETLKLDGYKLAEIKKMQVREEVVAFIS